MNSEDFVERIRQIGSNSSDLMEDDRNAPSKLFPVVNLGFSGSDYYLATSSSSDFASDASAFLEESKSSQNELSLATLNSPILNERLNSFQKSVIDNIRPNLFRINNILTPKLSEAAVDSNPIAMDATFEVSKCAEKGKVDTSIDGRFVDQSSFQATSALRYSSSAQSKVNRNIQKKRNFGFV